MPAVGDPGQRGRRQCGSRGAAAGGGRDAGLRIRRAARMPADPGPGRHLSGLCSQIQRRHGGHRRSAADVRAEPPAARSGPSPRHALRRRRTTGARRRIPVLARRRGRRRRARLSRASNANTIGQRTAASSRNWPNDCKPSAARCVKASSRGTSTASSRGEASGSETPCNPRTPTSLLAGERLSEKLDS